MSVAGVTNTVVTSHVVERQVVAAGVQGPRGPQGLQGPPGTAGGQVLSRTTAQNVSALRVVRDAGAGLVYAQPTTEDAYSVTGVTVAAALEGEAVGVQVSGVLEDASFSLTLGSPVYLGADGSLTQSAPASGAVVVVGRPLTPTSMAISVLQPIELTEVLP